jgi:hypothetical protein
MGRTCGSAAVRQTSPQVKINGNKRRLQGIACGRKITLASRNSFTQLKSETGPFYSIYLSDQDASASSAQRDFVRLQITLQFVGAIPSLSTASTIGKADPTFP